MHGLAHLALAANETEAPRESLEIQNTDPRTFRVRELRLEGILPELGVQGLGREQRSCRWQVVVVVVLRIWSSLQ